MSTLYKELAYDRVVSRVRGIQFSIMSDVEIRRRSVCEVTEPRTFEGNEPVPGGLFDTRMGVIDNSRVCATCHQRNTFCPGHFGHVSLVRACHYAQYYDIVRKLLGCVCFRCSKILVNLESPEVLALVSRKGLSNQKRWEAMHKLCARTRRCGQDTVDGCGAKKPDKISKTDDMKIKMQWKDAEGKDAAAEGGVGVGGGGGGGGGGVREQVFTADDVLRIFRRITDADAAALGFLPRYNRPEWMICTVMPVPPPAVRPSVRHETGQRQEDDLTHKLSDIIKTNNFVRDKISKNASYETVEQWAKLLQYHVATLIDNTMPNLGPSRDRAGRTFRSLCERLKHKEGRIRGNLMGKRVDFSARTVITPDPNLSIDELGVPLKIAMNLTFPDVVNEHNLEELRALVRTGTDGYPGAKHVRKTADGNRTLRLKGHPDIAGVAAGLSPGDVVERHLRNGDYVLFNRQPSLHKMSMMAHRVRVMEYNTFRLNVCVCACYNADFDGDEMNMHVPQSLQTHYELRELAAVPLHVVSPRYSKPIITIVQDVALGVYRITQSDVRVSQRQLFNLVASNPLLDPVLLPAPTEPGRWSGRQVLSTVLPPTVSVRMASSDREKDAPDYRAEDDEVVIRNGVIMQGVLNTSVYSKESRGLVHAAYNSLGPGAVTAMLNGTQKIICDWLVLSGFSVGVSDLVVSNATVGKMHGLLRDAKAKVYEAIQRVHAGEFENVSTKSDADFLEDQIGAALAAGSDAAGKTGRAGFNAGNNRMLNMIDSGSKGKPLNFTQMVACLGPQSIEQKRVPDGFDHRTLPHFTKYDDGPEARGFVEHSFIEGLSPHEFFFHSMAGRIGLIDTAVRTSETGYLQRKLVKAMEDCKIQHDLTVRNASGHIVQFLYGEDGMDAVKLEFQKMPYLSTSPAEMHDVYLLSAAEELRGHCRDDVVDAMAADEAAWRPRMEAHFRMLLDDRRDIITGICGGLSDDRPVVYPVNIARIVLHMSDLCASVGVAAHSDLHPLHVLDCIEQLCDELRVGMEPLAGKVCWMPVLLRCFLSPKALLRKYRLGRAGFDRVVEQVRAAFYEGIAAPSEMVGIVAAQSIGEPTTQLSVFEGARILVRLADKMYYGPIGEFVDSLLKQNAERVVDLGGDSVVLDVGDGDEPIRFQIVGVSDDEKTSWRAISQVSRHPANGGMVRIHTRSGRTTCATLSHSFLKRVETGVAPVLGSDLRVGDRVPVAKFIPEVCAPIDIDGASRELTRDSGWSYGAALAGQTVDDTIMSDQKRERVPAWVFGANLEYVRGLVSGYFQIDERGAGARAADIRSAPVSSGDTDGITDDIILLLAYLGIFASKCVDDAGRHSALISGEYALRFEREVVDRRTGTLDSAPSMSLDDLIAVIQRHEEQDEEMAPAGGIHIDSIPEIGDTLAAVCTALDECVPACARACGSIARVKLLHYLRHFEARRATTAAHVAATEQLLDAKMKALRQAAFSDVVWDEIVRIELLDDPKEYVYDFTVPGNDSFMVDCGVLVHNTLNTFHLAGAATGSTVTSGVPRMKELMSMSKVIKTPAMTIRLKREWATSMERADEVMANVQTTYFRDIVKSSSVYFDPSDTDTTIEGDTELMRFYKEFGALDRAGCDAAASPWLLRFEFDRAKMLDLKITMMDLEHVLVKFYADTVTCVFSDDNAERMVCRLRLSSGGSGEGADLLTEIKALEQSIMESSVVKGVKGIHKAVLARPNTGLQKYDPVLDVFVTNDEWTIATAGSNMIDVMRNDYVDYTRTTTNDVYEVYNVLGVEAARQVLIQELRNVLGDLPLDHRHLSLLADTMSNRGFFMSIDRHGINHRGELGPLAKCSFEQTTEMLIKAGAFSERDNINGVSANIMLGQIAPCGTGDCEILVDGDRLERLAGPVALPTDSRGMGRFGREAAAARRDADAAGRAATTADGAPSTQQQPGLRMPDVGDDNDDMDDGMEIVQADDINVV